VRGSAVAIALAGCGGDSIDGAPSCDAKKANLTGNVGAAAVSVDAFEPYLEPA